MGKGFDTFMDNPYWKRIYDEAPSDELREYYRIMFDHSSFVNGATPLDEAALKRLDEIILLKEDIEYLKLYAGIAQAEGYYQKALDHLADKDDGVGFRASVFRGEIRNPGFIPREQFE